MNQNATELLALAHKNKKLPKPESFEPSPENPVIAVQIGRIDGAPILVYGVRKLDWCLSGPHMSGAWYPFWKGWYLDREEALRLGNFEMFKESKEAHKLLEEAQPTELTLTYDLCCSQQVTPITGQPFFVYRVAAPSGWAFQWELRLEEDVCRVLHETLDERRRMPYGGYLDTSKHEEIEVGEVRTVKVSQCPHCLQIIYRYETLIVDDRGQLFRKSYLDQTKAEKAHEDVAKYVSQLIRSKREHEEKKLVEALKLSVWSPADDLRRSGRCSNLKHLLDPSTVERFEEAFAISISDETYLEEYDELERATKALKTNLDQVEISIFDEIVDNDLVKRLGELLDTHLPACPICQSAYQRTEDGLMDLLMFGRMRIECPCSKERYGYEKEPHELLREYLRFKGFLTSDEHSLVPNTMQSYYEVARVEMGGRLIACMSIGYSGERITLFVDRETLKIASGTPRFINTWPKTKAKAEEKWAGQLEENVADGARLKLRFRWSSVHRNWSSRVSNADGSTTTYVIHRDSETKMTGDGWYYCLLVNPDPRPSDKPRSVIGARPLLRVPIKHIPIESSRGPFHR